MNDKINIINDFKEKLKLFEKKIDITNTKKKEFLSSYYISDKLKTFLKLDKQFVSYSKILELLIKYIKDNNLQNERNIVINEELKNLFGIEDNKNITFINLNKLLYKHLIIN